MPFYGCPECGWATTASRLTAAQAHKIGVPNCGGKLELIEDLLFPGDESEEPAMAREAQRRLGTPTAPHAA